MVIGAHQCDVGDSINFTTGTYWECVSGTERVACRYDQKNTVTEERITHTTRSGPSCGNMQAIVKNSELH